MQGMSTSVIISQMVQGIAVIDDVVKEFDKDDVDTEEAVKRGLKAIREVLTAVGMNIESEHARVVKIVEDKLGNNVGYGGGKKSVMEYKVIQHLKPVTGEKSTFRQWRQKGLSAISQEKSEYGVMIEDLAKYIDLGKPVDKVLRESGVKYGAYWREVSEDTYKILVDHVEGDQYKT